MIALTPAASWGVLGLVTLPVVAGIGMAWCRERRRARLAARRPLANRYAGLAD